MPIQPQLRNGETATERQQRREALLSYGHVFAEAHMASQGDVSTETTAPREGSGKVKSDNEG